ncbi:hypothetical protein J2X90_003176 [Variovorax paradoxus]|uniref:glycosyltransferase family 2 protein n=1 Tax=Variovorax paradoxus TaxID=34073 RepID=UPI00277EBAC5|nr:glycosyltransferase family A protein [Variovorax paradoxus]MDQ0025359.1 hypothetical protein [Variovorax paradoxus]
MPDSQELTALTDLQRAACAAIEASGFFDAAWYARQLGNASLSDSELIVHYVAAGASRGLCPSPFFDGDWYLKKYPDVVDSGYNPFFHYIAHGLAEQRQPRASIDPCLQTALARISLLEHKLVHEQQRVDHLLGEVEGLAHYRDQFEQVRHTKPYQAVFENPAPLVTVCIATAGRSDLLVERCLASVVNQTYRKLQIIVVGDHCLDDTEQRLLALNDPRIEFYNMPSRGPYPRPGRDRWLVAGTEPGNMARLMAKGDFITYLDDDDAFEPHRIERLLAVARETRADFIWHGFWYLQRDGSWTPHGKGRFELGEVGTSMVFHHGWFKILPFDVRAYRIQEPGDWNFARRINYLRPKKHFLSEQLTRYYKSYEETPFVAQKGEEFLD